MVNHRKRLRLTGYDYSRGGAYFVTVCLKLRRELFGTITHSVEAPQVETNELGEMVHDEWMNNSVRFSAVALDEFVVMPDHVHGIVFIHEYEKGDPRVTPTLGRVVGAFKSCSARSINSFLGACGPVWQRGFYDRIIRDENELSALRRYIRENPLRWRLKNS